MFSKRAPPREQQFVPLHSASKNLVPETSSQESLCDHVRLNVTPSSNYLLGRVEDLKTHPIATLYRSGVDVTVNSDDVLIFDSDVSKEYLRLYQSGCLLAEELDDIRMNGLKTVLRLN